MADLRQPEAFKSDIRLWAPATGKTLAVLKGTGRQVFAVGFAAGERSIAWGNSYSGLKSSDWANKRGPLEIALRLPGKMAKCSPNHGPSTTSKAGRPQARIALGRYPYAFAWAPEQAVTPSSIC